MSHRTTIVIEGWHHIPHSYAMCLMEIELELLRRADVQLFHTELCYIDPQWTPDFRLFPQSETERLRSIPPRPPHLKPDAVIRMGWPFYFHPDPSGCPTYVWGTSECRTILPHAMGSRRLPTDELPTIPSRIIALSDWAAAGFLECGAPAERVHVIPAGVNTARLYPPSDPVRRETIRAQCGWTDSIVLLNVGAMTGNKGIHLILQAAGHLLDRFPNLRVVLKGSDALYRSQSLLQHWANTLPEEMLVKLDPHVNYTGSTLDHEQLRQLFQGADLYVAPYFAEGFNLPVLEAAACGLPVICTRGGSTDDFVDDSWCRRIRSELARGEKGVGFGVKPDVDHLVELIEQTIIDRHWRSQAAIAGPSWVAQRFTWKHVVDQLLDLVRRFA